MRAAPGPRRLAVASAIVALSSCAYYNTFYLARKYYDRGAGGLPYVVEKPDPVASQNFTKSIDYSKKVIAHYPKSKWVDDAYLLWARALMGKDDPEQTVNMLRDFSTRYPQSPLKEEALFYLGVADRKTRKYAEALTALEEFLRRGPKHPLAPYAYLEQARVLMALERQGEAVQAATRGLERFPQGVQRDRAVTIRAEALLAKGDHELARADYNVLGGRATSDEERFKFLLKEADCLESGRLYEQELALLQDAITHEQEPQRVAAQSGIVVHSGPAGSGSASSPARWAGLMLRIGTVHMLQGRQEEALQDYRRVIDFFSQSAFGAEAQYRIAYVLETVADSLDRAREEYAKVARIWAASPFAAQASQRLVSLERLTQHRSGGGSDSLAKSVEAGFMLAELYLFQNNKPERALDEYRKIAREFAETPFAAKAMNAQAWVLRHKLDRAPEADSILWAVVHGFAKTEAQIHARDYLELAGHTVPDSLIQPPEQLSAPPETALHLTPTPPGVDSLGRRRPVPISPDSLARLTLIRAGEFLPPAGMVPRPGLEPRFPADSARAGADSTRGVAPADTTKVRSPPDESAPPDSTEEKR